VAIGGTHTRAGGHPGERAARLQLGRHVLGRGDPGLLHLNPEPDGERPPSRRWIEVSVGSHSGHRSAPRSTSTPARRGLDVALGALLHRDCAPGRPMGHLFRSSFSDRGPDLGEHVVRAAPRQRSLSTACGSRPPATHYRKPAGGPCLAPRARIARGALQAHRTPTPPANRLEMAPPETSARQEPLLEIDRDHLPHTSCTCGPGTRGDELLEAHLQRHWHGKWREPRIPSATA
jgi:hypothetical protein